MAPCWPKGGLHLLCNLPVAQAPSPLQHLAWEAALQQHPDRVFADYVLQDIDHGFSIGFHETVVMLWPAKRNIPAAYDHSQVVDKYLHAECEMGRVLGPFLAPPAKALHISRFGVIPKKSQPRKWRLIVDLSAPEGHSVNDVISDELCSLRYPSFDTAVHLLAVHGPGAHLSKLDIKEAYRMIPVHPWNWFLLGILWN